MQRIVTVVFTALLLAMSILWLLQSPEAKEYEGRLRARLSSAFEKAALPFRLAQLASDGSDQQIFVPIENLPVRNISDSWGASRSGGRTHEGVDMFAKKGTPIRSATNGYVIYVGTNPLGGNVVFVYGRGGVRYYYAHLDAFAGDIRVGKWVSTSTVIGFVGNTGNAEGTPPHLHFGMYKNGAQNPYPLLVER